MKHSVAVLALVLFPLSSFAQHSAQHREDEKAVEHVLVTAYVEGIHANRDAEAVRSGFHPDFVMHVYDDGTLIQAPLSMWLERLQLDGKRNPKKIEHQVDLIDVTGNAAVAKMQIYADKQHLYTDYFGLYRFDDGWKIVNKIFYGHQ